MGGGTASLQSALRSKESSYRVHVNADADGLRVRPAQRHQRVCAFESETDNTLSNVERAFKVASKRALAGFAGREEDRCISRGNGREDVARKAACRLRKGKQNHRNSEEALTAAVGRERAGVELELVALVRARHGEVGHVRVCNTGRSGDKEPA